MAHPTNPFKNRLRKPYPFSGPLLAICGLLVATAMASCTSEPVGRKKAFPAMGEQQPTLQGQGLLAGGGLQVRASLQDLLLVMGAPKGPGEKPGFGQLSMAMPAGGAMPGGDRPDLPPEFLAQMQHQMSAMTVKPPRLILRVELINNGKESLDLSIKEVVCVIGNFAPRPAHIMLAPGQRVELDPMLSNAEERFEYLKLKLSAKQAGLPTEESCEISLTRSGAQSHE